MHQRHCGARLGSSKPEQGAHGHGHEGDARHVVAVGGAHKSLERGQRDQSRGGQAATGAQDRPPGPQGGQRDAQPERQAEPAPDPERLRRVGPQNVEIAVPTRRRHEELVHNPVGESARIGEVTRQQRSQRVVQRRLMRFARRRVVRREVRRQRTGLRDVSRISPVIGLVRLGRRWHEQERRQRSQQRQEKERQNVPRLQPSVGGSPSIDQPSGASNHVSDDSTSPNHRQKDAPNRKASP